MRIRPLLASLIAAVALTGLPAGQLLDNASADSPTPVLGSADHLAPYASGYGRAHPRRIDNGGSPSGIAQHLTWHSWGAKRSKADGRTFLYKPGGGYYQRRGQIELRAQKRGTCADGTYGYTELYFRIAKRPGEPVSGAWRPWSSDDGDLCD